MAKEDNTFNEFIKGEKCKRCKKAQAYALMRQYPVCKKCFHLLKEDNKVLIKKGMNIPKSLIVQFPKRKELRFKNIDQV